MLHSIKTKTIHGFHRGLAKISTEAVPPDTAPYQYSPLETESTVRILALRPHEGRTRDYLRCNLLHIALDSFQEDTSLTTVGSRATSCTSFEAISYAWGSPVFCKRLVCYSSQFAITESLHSALMTFRLADRIRYLWADAVCIDQSNKDERSSQVTLMGRIYSTAQRVLAWLGEDFDTEAYFNSIMLLDDLPRDSRQDSRNCLAFSRRPYFSRRWIIQELSLARSVTLYCGQASIDWDILLRWYAKEDRRVVGSKILSMRPESLLDYRSYLSPGQNIIELLGFFRDFACKDDRDLVYALLGLRTRTDSIDIKPDYSQSTVECYVRFAVECLKGDSYPLRILHYAGIAWSQQHYVRTTGLPSWVPDWRYKASHSVHDSATNRQWPGTEKPRFTTTVELSEVRESKSQADTLSIWGIHLGHIVVLDDGDSVTTSLGFNITRGSRDCREGDIACMFDGAVTPFILRSRGDYFTLARECGIQGIPNGLGNYREEYIRPIDLKARQDLERRWFVIR